jgi:hypothetical protein
MAMTTVGEGEKEAAIGVVGSHKSSAAAIAVTVMEL